MPACRNFGPDARVEAHALGDLDDVGAGLLAHVGDLVDERDLRRQERVGGQLDHLGAGDVGAHELTGALTAVLRGQQGAVQLDDRVAGPVAVVADDDAVGLQEVGDRRALLQELGAGDVAEAALALLLEQALDALAGAARDGRLHDERVVVRRRHRGHDGVDRGEVGVAAVGRRRADRDEQQPGRTEGVLDVRREVQAFAVALDHLGEAGLVDRHFAVLQPLDLAGVDVDAVDVVAQLRESRRSDESDVAGADDADGLSVCHEAGKGSGRAPYFAPTRVNEPAIPSIWVLVSDCNSVLWTQYTARSVRHAIEPQTIAVEEQFVGASVDPPLLRRAVEDGWRSPRRALDAVVLPDAWGLDHHPVGAELAPVPVEDVVGALVLDPVAGPQRGQAREVDGEGELGPELDRLVLRGPACREEALRDPLRPSDASASAHACGRRSFEGSSRALPGSPWRPGTAGRSGAVRSAR